VKHFLSIADASAADLQRILRTAVSLRREKQNRLPNRPVLEGKTLALIFEKPSLRTKVSFQQAIIELGGNSVVLGSEVGLEKRETVHDIILVLEGMVDGVVARVFEHQKLLDMARFGSIPVVNALSDFLHPCQAMADALTLWDEFGEDIQGKTLSFIGDGNNVARSLAQLTGKLDVNYVIASPPGYEIEAGFVKELVSNGRRSGFKMVRDPCDAVRGADVVYTDIWASMGQEKEQDARRDAFRGYQVNRELLQLAPRHAIVMHCLPAARNSEITDDVKYGEQSRVFQQAHNRLHIQKGLLAVLFGDGTT
jgi:ornithine carbamoyltransferase